MTGALLDFEGTGYIAHIAICMRNMLGLCVWRGKWGGGGGCSEEEGGGCS